MNPDEVTTIYNLMVNRVTPRSALEGVAIAQLAMKLMTHFKLALPPVEGQPAPPVIPVAEAVNLALAKGKKGKK